MKGFRFRAWCLVKDGVRLRVWRRRVQASGLRAKRSKGLSLAVRV